MNKHIATLGFLASTLVIAAPLIALAQYGGGGGAIPFPPFLDFPSIHLPVIHFPRFHFPVIHLPLFQFLSF